MRLPPDGADRGINQTHANIISGQAEIGWGEREKLNIEAYLLLHNFACWQRETKLRRSLTSGLSQGRHVLSISESPSVREISGSEDAWRGDGCISPGPPGPSIPEHPPSPARAFITAMSLYSSGGGGRRLFSFSISSPPTLQPCSGGLSPLLQSAPAGPFAFVSH